MTIGVDPYLRFSTSLSIFERIWPIKAYFAMACVFRQQWYEHGMTPAQCRAARGLLNWNQADLATKALVSTVTVRNFENEKSTPQRASLDVMRRAFEEAGVVFIAENGGGPGVRLKATAKSP